MLLCGGETMKKFLFCLGLLALAAGDFSFVYNMTGCFDSRWDGAEKRFGNWVSASGCGRVGTCQQGVGAFPTDVWKFKNVTKSTYGNVTGTSLVLPQECEVIQE
jgi:hypothetical protein